MNRIASFKTTVRKTALCVAALVGLAASAAPASANDCNPLTLLFGGCAQARVAPALPAYEAMDVTPQASRGKTLPAVHAKKPSADAAQKHASRKAGGTEEAGNPQVHRREAAAPGRLDRPLRRRPDAARRRYCRDHGRFPRVSQQSVYPIAQDGGALAQLEKASMQPKSADISEILTTSGEKSGLVALRRAIRVASNQ